jgi:hypothetical protein
MDGMITTQPIKNIGPIMFARNYEYAYYAVFPIYANINNTHLFDVSIAKYQGYPWT